MRDPATERVLALFPALKHALMLDALGYVCTPATTRDTVVDEMAPVKGKSGKLLRDDDGVFIKAKQRANKPPKVTIGLWSTAERGADATKRRFERQMERILRSAEDYGLEQGADNLGVAIITSKSGIAVIDIDAGKMPDPNDPNEMLDADAAHYLLLSRMLEVAKIPEAERAHWIERFKRQMHVRTPSGGWHYYFRRKEAQRPRMHTGMIRYVDVRAGFRNEVGEWQSASVAYAPGNVTQKGRYVAYRVDESGNAIELETLPAVSDLPELPDELNALFEKSTTAIRNIASELGIPVPETARAKSNVIRAPAGSRETMMFTGDMSKWKRLATKFVRGSSNAEGAGQ
jgi:hypothetical protein